MKFKSKNKMGTEFIWDPVANKVAIESENGILETDDLKLIERLKAEGYEEVGIEPIPGPIKQPEPAKPKLGRPRKQ